MQENKHVGVYGVAIEDGKILVIKKSRGPYKGKYDLPGGGVEFGEKLEEALFREFSEEIGSDIQIDGLMANVVCISEWIYDGVPTNTHHIGMYYKVKLLSTDIKTEKDGHDSDGALWLKISDINEHNMSAIFYKLIEKIELK